MTARHTVPVAFALGLFACSSPAEINVQIVNPCNKDVLGAVDYLKFEPRGTDVDSEGLTTITSATDGSAPAINIPLAEDFHLVVTGHRDSFDTPPRGIGVSGSYDLREPEGPITIQTVIAPVDEFSQTTDVTTAECTALQVKRYGATSTFLPVSGKVLIVGGEAVRGNVVEYPLAIEVYDPRTGIYERVADVRPELARAFHTATLLNDGTILIAGGERVSPTTGTRESLRSAFIIDPGEDASTIEISQGIIMKQPRSGHVAALVDDGKAVLLAGGREYQMAAGRPEEHVYRSSIEIFNPEGLFYYPNDGTGTQVEMRAKRAMHRGTVLKSGRDVVISGGMNETGPERSIELLRVMNCDRPQGGCKVTVTATAAGIAVGPMAHGAALAPTTDGRTVLLAGGYNEIRDIEPMGGLPVRSTRAVEMWEFREPSSFIKVCSAVLDVARGHHTLSMIGDRAVFVGGFGEDGKAHASGSVAVVAPNNMNCFKQQPASKNMKISRAQHSATVLGSGEVLISGGRKDGGGGDPFGLTVAEGEIFSPSRIP